MHLIRGHLATSGDFGLTLGSLVCDFIQIFCQEPDSTLIGDVTRMTRQTIGEVLEQNRVKIDVGNLSQMLSVIRTILISKPLLKSGRTSKSDKDIFLNRVSAKILEGFLQTIPKSGNIEFDVNLNMEIGNGEEVEIRDGYIFSVPDIPPEMEWHFRKLENNRKIRIIALNLQIKEDCSELSEMLSNVSIETQTCCSANVEKEFLNRRIETLANFCVENRGGLSKILNWTKTM